MRSSIVGLVLRRLLFTVLVALSCFGAAVPSTLAQDGLKEPPAVDEDEGAGLEGNDRWVSPQFGVDAAWDESWRVTASRTWSRPETGEDRLVLESIGNRDGDLYLIVREPGRGSVPADVEAWTSDEFLEIYDVDDLDVLLTDTGTEESDGGVLIGLSDTSMPFPQFHYKQSIANEEGLALYVLIEAPAPVFLNVWKAVETGFTLNGSPVELRFDLDEIEEAMASYEAVEFSEEDAGLVGTQRYEGPVCGIALEWTDSWEVSEYLDVPVASDPIGLVDEFYMNQAGARDFGPYLDVQGVGSVFTDSAERIDQRTRQEGMEYLWGPSVESEVVLREVRDDRAEALVRLELPESDEVLYMWSRYTWVEETQCNAYVELTAPVSDFEEAWTAVTGDFDIQIAGEPLEYILSWDEIGDAMAEGA